MLQRAHFEAWILAYERASSYKNLWIIVLDEDSRCRHFEEWPFFPGQLRAVPPD